MLERFSVFDLFGGLSEMCSASTERDNRNFQVAGHPIDKLCPEFGCLGTLLERQTKNGGCFVVCDRNVFKNDTTCSFSANKFRPDRDPTKLSNITCLACVQSVARAVPIGKVVDGLGDNGKPPSRPPCRPSPRAVEAGGHGGGRSKRKGPPRVEKRAAKRGERSFSPSSNDTILHFVLPFIVVYLIFK